ncbi:patatin-like phospholipase family protein [Ornithinibacillus sp. BX22]|uniref:Patatin-like phospholipase family protein n=2 Tax=Ornithinibacillus TaxID=484508 RepID=A0A923L674_9BACI|nr:MULTISPECIES: patatin-like phospholipase family protein [Ornithinibacillus]MBC5637186.1 patatin-like phospholipase family protein [Ornithinibacillus hominis]MBS3679603.1 patatin-like phospholipase family protein [Ornithinibacillus massiliensis]
MKIDGVFSGGGVKAYAFIGALEGIQEKKLEFERVAGTSAGAILAAFIASGYKVGEIESLLDELNLEEFLDPPGLTKILPGSKWFFLYFQMGLNKGDKFEKWIYYHLAKKGIFTFGDIKEGYLKVVVSDLTLGKLIVIPDDLERVYGINPNDFPVAKAVRMSAGFPYFFMPKKMAGKHKEKSLIVDGGLLSNFPIWVLESETNKRMRPILGLKLSDSPQHISPKKIKNALDMLHALFSTMKQAHDARYIAKSQKDSIIFIPVKDVQTVDFKIDQNVKERLVQSGREEARKFLKYWPA